jgi:UDP-N-acetyl-D-mannosaminuronic acid dehydrogenase
MIKLARQTNDLMPSFIAKLVQDTIKNKAGQIAVLGAAYKADIDDARESPAYTVIEELIKMGYKVKAYDPHVKRFKYKLEDSLSECIKDADCLVVVTDHKEFKAIDPTSISSIMKANNVIDTRNCLNHNLWRNAGFNIVLV